jgi:hypothetical protein
MLMLLPHSHQLCEFGHANRLEYCGLEQHPYLQRAVAAACPLPWGLVRHRRQPALAALPLACLAARPAK